MEKAQVFGEKETFSYSFESLVKSVSGSGMKVDK